MECSTKKRKLHLFNPENDVCLGLGDKSYNMPRMVHDLHVAGAALPLWWCGDGDMVYAPEVSGEWMEKIKSQFPVNGSLWNKERGAEGYAGAPWGWSHDAKRQLKETGCDVIDDNRIEKIRQLSHRRTSINILEKLNEASVLPLPPLPKEIFTVEEARHIAASYPVTYFKAPWSSSGRGVMAVDAMTPKDESRISSIIKKQGSIIAEKGLVKKRDFAMLFLADAGKVTFIGYSVFFNERGTAYVGNVLGSNEYLKEVLIADGASPRQLAVVESMLPQVLENVIGESYDGYFGVDMLLDAYNNVMPCIELNLRMTMGVVARLFHDRYMNSDSRGTYRVAPSASSICCPVVSNGKLVGGELALTPGGAFSFVVKVN